MSSAVRHALSSARRYLRLKPMHGVFRELRHRSVPTADLDALEVFGGDGRFHTVDYGDTVRSLDVWEHDPSLEHALHSALPEANVSICDSFAALRTTAKRYDLIVVDNPSSLFGPDNKYCEHFDLFPDLFNVARERFILVLNVTPSVNAAALREFPYLFNDVQLARRAEFYGTSNPRDIAVADMIPAYAGMAAASHFELAWWFVQLRRVSSYLVMSMEPRSRP